MKYVLTLFANNGETAILEFDTLREAVQLKRAFMCTGDYFEAQITEQDGAA
jgi:hypothetical protein